MSTPTTTSLSELPGYTEQLAAFHRAFAGELRAIIQSLPISPQMSVIDVGCGDGFYLGLLAERLGEQGRLTGLDTNKAFLELAREQVSGERSRCQVEFASERLSQLAAHRPAEFDFVWCAQGLYSLPEPVSALRQMAALLKPGGTVAVLENDTLHQLLLPWPSELEIAIRTAELAALAEEHREQEKFYVGRRLPAVLAEAGLEPLGFRTQSIDRQAPLNPDLATFVQLYLQELSERVSPRLPRRMAAELARWTDRAGETYLPAQAHFTLSWINVLAWGRKRVAN